MQRFRQIIVSKAQQFKDDERGVGTTFAIFMAIICIGIGGLAIDVSNAWQMRQRLQTTADVAAHAGALMVVYPDASGVKTTVSEAIGIARINMPTATFQNVLTSSDIIVGRWNLATHEMTVSNLLPPNAVEVITRLDDTNKNPLGTFFLRLMGFSHWQISTRAVAMISGRDCFNDGFIAGGWVRMSSNNKFENSFCLHGQTGVRLVSNNRFDHLAGVRISLPDITPYDSTDPNDLGGLLVEGSNNGPDGTNSDVYGALTENDIAPELATAASISNLVTNYSSPTYSGLPDYIDETTVFSSTVTVQDQFSMDMIRADSINRITCNGNGQGGGSKITLTGNLKEVIIVTNCAIEFGSNARIEDAIILSTNTGVRAIHAPSGLQVGKDDGCVEGGGVQIVTLGGADFAAGASFYGSQIIALDDISMSAQAGFLNGVSFQTGGDISLTSLGAGGGTTDPVQVTGCTGGVDTIVEQYVIHIVF